MAGRKDVNEAWAAGVLRLSGGPGAEAAGAASIAVPEEMHEVWEERRAMMVLDGGLARAEAEPWAWASLQAAAGRTGSGTTGDAV